MNDLVKRLREYADYRATADDLSRCLFSAADFIEAQAKRIEQLEEALQFYRDGFRYHVKRTSMGINLSEWKPTEELLNDCGETARAVLAGEKKDG